MVVCAAPGCPNNSRHGIYKFYRFPADSERRKLWLINAKRGDLTQTTESRLCNVHFEESQFEHNRADGRKLLKPNAIPTIFKVSDTLPGLENQEGNTSNVGDLMEKISTDPIKVEDHFEKEEFTDSCNNKNEEIKIQSHHIKQEINHESNTATEDSDVIGTLEEDKYLKKVGKLSSTGSLSSFSSHSEGKSFDSEGSGTKEFAIQDEYRPHICIFCEKNFRKKTNLNKHLLVHTGELPYDCEHCEKSFRDKSNLIKHIRLHSGDLPYCCDVCEKRFNGKRDFDAHLRLHTGVRPFICVFCKKGFRTKYDLSRHIRVHAEESPFICTICNKSFKIKSSLNKHNRLHAAKLALSMEVNMSQEDLHILGP